MPTDKPLPCARCNSDEKVRVRPDGPAWVVVCDGCYDGAPDASPLVGYGMTRAQAIDEWDEVNHEERIAKAEGT